MKIRHAVVRYVIPFCFAAVIGCQEANMPVQDSRPQGAGAGATVNGKGYARLGEMRIYFGHQSAGTTFSKVRKRSSGIPGAGPSIVEFKAGDSPPDVRGILHSKVGRNGRPLKKIEDFRLTALAGVAGSRWDLAFFKFCYADFYEENDVDAVFAAYKTAVREVESERPGLRVIHLTVPLTNGKPTLKERVKKILGRGEIEYAGNIKRNRFNEMLRAEYEGKAPLFDLAKLESVRSDGTRAAFRSDGRDYEMLAEEYTDDGAHLNARGRIVVAGPFIAFLSGLPGK
jgi:hypothetical protein